MTRRLLIAVLAASAPAASAGSAPLERGEPGSLLLFPEYDGTVGKLTLVTVTNTDGFNSPSTVGVRWVYVDGSSCQEYDQLEELTPNDTLSVVTNVHNPQEGEGYLYVYAVDPVTQAPLAHNHLIGHATVLDGLAVTSHTVHALPYLGIDPDFEDDGLLRLDGVEYERAADEILVPRFMGQGSNFQSYLVLVDLTGGPGASTTLAFELYNDNEDVFSAEHTFSCWDRVPLLSVSALFGNNFLQVTNHDAFEIFGLTEQEAGWIRIDGVASVAPALTIPDPAFVAMLVDRSDLGVSTAPIAFEGVQGGATLGVVASGFAEAGAGRPRGADPVDR